MLSGGYYVHNINPNIFTLDQIPADWTRTIWGIAIIVAINVASFLYFRWDAKRATHESQENLARNVLTSIFLFLIFAFDAILVLKNVHIIKGMITGVPSDPVYWGLRWYSLMYLIGFTFVYFMCRHWIRKRTIMLTPVLLDSLIAHGVIGMILGARIAYVFIYNWDQYEHNLKSVFYIWEGGLSFHGGIIGVIVALLIFCKKYKIPFFHIADKMAFCVPVGIGFGRIGNFMNGELYGRIIDKHVPWAMIFNIGYGGMDLGGGPQPRHPSQLYQSLCEGWLLFLTLFIISRRKTHVGAIGAAFLFFYGIYRFFMEFFREADKQLQYYFNNTLTMGQILCILTSVAGVAVYFYVRQNPVTGTPEWQKQIDAFFESRKKIEG